MYVRIYVYVRDLLNKNVTILLICDIYIYCKKGNFKLSREEIILKSWISEKGLFNYKNKYCID